MTHNQERQRRRARRDLIRLFKAFIIVGIICLGMTLGLSAALSIALS